MNLHHVKPGENVLMFYPVRYMTVINRLLHANAQNMAEEFNPEPVPELLIKSCIFGSIASVTLHIHLIRAILIEEAC